MAKILYGPAIAEARGSVAGTTFSRNTYGPYIRNKTSPVQPQSNPQQQQRSAFSSISRRWRDTLTAAQREAWEDYAAGTPIIDVFGNKQTLKGNAIYCAFNSTWLRNGETPVDVAPVTPGEAPMLLATINFDAVAGIELDAFTPTLLNADKFSIQESAFPCSQGRNFFNGPFTHSSWEDGDVAVPVVLRALADTSSGQRWWYRFRVYISDGRIGPPSLFSVDVP